MSRSITQNLNQERIVLTATVVVFLAAAIWLPGFIMIDNLVAIARSVVVLGVLALGIIGRGIDLSMVAVMAMSVAWYLQLINDGGTDPGSFLKWNACLSPTGKREIHFFWWARYWRTQTIVAAIDGIVLLPSR